MIYLMLRERAEYKSQFLIRAQICLRKKKVKKEKIYIYMTYTFDIT